MTNPVTIFNIAFSTIFSTTPVKNRQLIGELMVKDREKPILTHLKLGKWRLTDVEATTPAGTEGDIGPKRLHS